MNARIRGLALLFCAVAATAPAVSRARDDAPERTIEISAHRFEFEPASVHLKKGEPVVLAVTSEDVKHGFFSRPLHIDESLAPGATAHIRLEPQEAGSYTVICHHYCGSGHGGMKMTIVVE
jgi:cytochrome c oxidase subunit 2